MVEKIFCIFDMLIWIIDRWSWNEIQILEITGIIHPKHQILSEYHSAEITGISTIYNNIELFLAQISSEIRFCELVFGFYFFIILCLWLAKHHASYMHVNVMILTILSFVSLFRLSLITPYVNNPLYISPIQIVGGFKTCTYFFGLSISKLVSFFFNLFEIIRLFLENGLFFFSHSFSFFVLNFDDWLKD